MSRFNRFTRRHGGVSTGAVANMSGGANLSGGLSGFPNHVDIVLRYSVDLEFTCTAGVPVYYQLKGNDVFDPDYTGTGHQPLAFDEWATFYTYYRVASSAFKVAVVPTNTATATQDMVQVTVASYPAFQSTAPVLPEALEYPYIKAVTVNGASQVATLTNTMTTWKLLGIEHAKWLADPGYSAAVSASPAFPWYWNCYIEPLRAGTDCKFNAELIAEYRVRFWGRRQLADSLACMKGLQNKLEDRKVVRMQRATVKGAEKADEKAGTPKGGPTLAKEDGEDDFAEFLKWKATQSAGQKTEKIK